MMAAPMNEKPTPVLIEVQQNENVGIKRKLNCQASKMRIVAVMPMKFTPVKTGER